MAYYRVHVIKISDDSIRTLYRYLNGFSTLCTDVADDDVPTNAVEFFRKYNVYWLDEESHRIMINKEVDYSCMSYKVKNTPNKQPTLYLEERLEPGSMRSEIVTHEGIVCSRCKIAHIVGYRYKCTQCEDYNLCSGCEALKAHREHVMLRFSTPENGTSFNEKFLLKKKAPKSMSPGLNSMQMGTEGSACEGVHDEETAEGNKKKYPREVSQIDHNLLKTGVHILGSLSEMFSKMLSTAGALERADIPEDQQEERSDSTASKPTSAETRPRRDSEASTFSLISNKKTSGYMTDDTDPIVTLSTLFARFRETIREAEEQINKVTTAGTDREKESEDFDWNTKIHRSEKIDNALKDLIAMGFNEKNDWLVHLLTVCDGDVNKALDMLKPAKKFNPEKPI